jgi:hypothetical protein
MILPASGSQGNSFEEERREVLDCVFEALRSHQPDPDEMAACGYLVRHLSGDKTRYAP